MVVNDFKITIKAKKVPVNINNEVIEYIQDNTIQSNHLNCEVFFQETLIAQGIILDFYKEFEILQDFKQNLFTHILTFEWNNTIYTKNTYFGQKVFEIKNFKNPVLAFTKREAYLNEIISHFNGYIEYLKTNYTNLVITCIPSNSKIPEDISNKLSTINTIPLITNITKNSLIASKTITNLSEQSLNKYIVDLSNLSTVDNVILIDDVMGTSASLCETMHKLYNFNKKVNFFFIPVKDVKR